MNETYLILIFIYILSAFLASRYVFMVIRETSMTGKLEFDIIGLVFIIIPIMNVGIACLYIGHIIKKYVVNHLQEKEG